MKYMALFFTIDWCDIFTLRISPQMFTQTFFLYTFTGPLKEQLLNLYSGKLSSI